MVTKASSKYFSQEKTDGGIKVQKASRMLMSKADSKQDLFNLAKFRIGVILDLLYPLVCINIVNTYVPLI